MLCVADSGYNMVVAAAAAALQPPDQSALHAWSCWTSRQSGEVTHANTASAIFSYDGANSRLKTNVTTCSAKSVNTMATSWLFGPFTSTGGYDWWSIVANTTQEDRPAIGVTVGGYSLTIHEGAPSLDGTQGPQLGLPPIHRHHAYAVFQCGSNGPVSFSYEGDQQCPGEVEGFDCLTHDFAAAGFMKVRPESSGGLNIGAIFNDMRPAGSPPLAWYYNVTLTFASPVTRIEPIDAGPLLRPIASVAIQHSGHRMTADGPSFFGTARTPSRVESFLAFEGHWNIDGRLVDDLSIIWHHTHTEIFHSSFLISATAKQVSAKDSSELSPEPSTVSRVSPNMSPTHGHGARPCMGRARVPP